MALSWRAGGRFRSSSSRSPATIVANIVTLQLLFYGAASALLIALGATFGTAVDIFHIIDPRRLRFDGGASGIIDAVVTIAGFVAATMAMPATIGSFKLVPDHAFTLLFVHFSLCCITGVRFACRTANNSREMRPTTPPCGHSRPFVYWLPWLMCRAFRLDGSGGLSTCGRA